MLFVPRVLQIEIAMLIDVREGKCGQSTTDKGKHKRQALPDALHSQAVLHEDGINRPGKQGTNGIHERKSEEYRA